MKIRIALAVVISAALVGGGFIFATLQPAALGTNNSQNASLFGKLHGFKPGAKVVYNIFPEEGKSASGAFVIDKDGTLNLPPYNLYNASGKELNYALEIDEGAAKPLNVTLNLKAGDGKIGVDMKGLSALSDVKLNGHTTRADWAGLLKDPMGGDFGDIDKKEGFRVAFFNNNSIMNDAEGKNPKIIEVLAAPGGGTLFPPINEYSTPYGCNDGYDTQVDYSFCDDDAMDQQIQNIVDNYVTALMMMTHQFTAVMAAQVYAIAPMLDAKAQLESQLQFRAMVAEANKDYQPSEMMCEFGTFVRDMTNSEENSAYQKLALNDILMGYYSDLHYTSGTEGQITDIKARLRQFRTVYCDVSDNNNGLNFLCDHDQAIPTVGAGGADPNRLNSDIEYGKTIDNKLTLDFDLAYAHRPPGTVSAPPTADEEDAVALARNLYWPEVLPPGQAEELPKIFDKYLDARRIFAMSNIAHNSYASIIGLKSKSPPSKTTGANGAAADALSGGNYMQAMLRNFGMENEDIVALLGEYPSYYAQMEVLTKKIYQQPDFYTNLYDKPANVKRISATMQALQIMQGRDFYESALRRELLTSLMVEEALAKHVDRINGLAVSDMKNLQRP